jgi:LmbE family N-acetylglucosaminyl deacetylase
LPQRSKPSQRLHAALRYVLFGLALPCVYFGGASAAFFYRQRAANTAEARFRLSPAPAPASATRLMVFAPHCDDETLGCAGLIQQTLAAGGAARAVIMTNGDGFRTAVERQMRQLRVGPNDYIAFAALRQQESYRALENLGVKPDDVLFLGYPDRGLMPLWNSCWAPDRPYTSTYTRRNCSPYANTFTPHARYCGASIIADIKTALRAFHPTLVTVTHPAEDHPDHAAAAAFVTRALQELQADPRERAWASKTRLEFYLIHRGDWPIPQGARPADPLLPPAEMAHVDTHWTMLPLTPPETERKARSIELYPSQIALMRRFLISFGRRNELYGEIAPTRLMTVPDQSIRVDADPQDWEQLPPALLDPVRDNVLRDLQGGGDIRAFYACRDSRRLYMRLDTRQPISRRITYTLRLRAFGPNGESGPTAYTVSLRAVESGTEQADGLRVAVRGRMLEAALPWANLTRDLGGLPVSTLAVSAETTLAGVEIDKTGVRFLSL